ncbi:HesA/MoeB/ThiF family protein [Candidatus Pelagibacter sp.]|nr:HesA/MoeB/ThiF family protein [Candidatus Pelagibacter sp.]
MTIKLNKNLIERFSRQIVLKDIGIIGQKKIMSSKVLIIGAGGLGCPAAEFLTRAGIGALGIVDYDKVCLSNIHRQTLYDSSNIGMLKVRVLQSKLKKINPKTKVKIYQFKLDKNRLNKIIGDYDYIVDGSDNFKTKFLLNDISLKYKKFLTTGAVSKFDGHVFTFDFKNKKIPCLRCFFQETKILDNFLNCEFDGILGTVAGIVGTIQANEVLKKILNVGRNLDGFILILNFLKLDFRKVIIKKRKNCFCK